MICPRCTASIADDYLYCPRCGQSTAPRTAGEDITPPAAPAADGNPDSHAATPAHSGDSTSSTLVREAKPENGAWRDEFFALSEDEINSCLTQANLYRVRRQWTEAIDKCVMVLRAQPGNPTAHSLLGDIYRDRGNPVEAVQWYRMAVDLHPNPADEAKLRQMEKESALKDIQTTASPAAAAGVPGGTTALMGVSPRRWLNGLTLAAVAFLFVMAIVLLAIPNHQQNNTPVARPVAYGGTLNTNTDRRLNEVLPPIHPGGDTVLPPGEQKRETSQKPYTGGTGLPPDLTPSAVPSAPPASPGAARETGKPAPAIPPAPVGSVRPMLNSGDPGSDNVNSQPYQPQARDSEPPVSGNTEEITPLRSGP